MSSDYFKNNMDNIKLSKTKTITGIPYLVCFEEDNEVFPYSPNKTIYLPEYETLTEEDMFKMVLSCYTITALKKVVEVILKQKGGYLIDFMNKISLKTIMYAIDNNDINHIPRDYGIKQKYYYLKNNQYGYKLKIVIGDASGDGHMDKDIYYIRTNYHPKVIKEAFEDAMINLDLPRFCVDYGEACFNSKIYNKIVSNCSEFFKESYFADDEIEEIDYDNIFPNNNECSFSDDIYPDDKDYIIYCLAIASSALPPDFKFNFESDEFYDRLDLMSGYGLKGN